MRTRSSVLLCLCLFGCHRTAQENGDSGAPTAPPGSQSASKTSGAFEGVTLQEKLRANAAAVEGARFVIDADLACYDGGAPFLHRTGERQVLIDPSLCRVCVDKGTPAESCRPLESFNGGGSEVRRLDHLKD